MGGHPQTCKVAHVFEAGVGGGVCIQACWPQQRLTVGAAGAGTCLQEISAEFDEVIWNIDPTTNAYSCPKLTRQLHASIDGMCSCAGSCFCKPTFSLLIISIISV